MRRFECFHPLALLVFFISVLFPVMFYMNLNCSVAVLIIGIIYRWVLIKKVDIKNILVSIICIVVVTLANMLISHSGERIILFINDRAITIEAMMYGLTTGTMIAGTLTWFMCLERVLGGEKIQSLFKHMPKFGLLISMILRLVPRYVDKYKRVMAYNPSADGVKVSSGVFTYALENSMQTAESMENRGFAGAKVIYNGCEFKLKDLALIIVNLFVAVFGIIFKGYRLYAVIFISVLPFIYRAKETLKLWIYNLKK